MKGEMAQVVYAVAKQLCIPSETVFDAMESAIHAVGKKKYGHDHEIRVIIDRTTGDVEISRILFVVEEVEDSKKQISLSDALEQKSDANIGDEIFETLPPIDLGRVSATSAKGILLSKITEATKLREYEEYKSREGDIVTGIVERIEYGNVIVNVGKAEALLYRYDIIAGENFRQGDRVKAYIKEVRKETKNVPQILLSRTCNEFMYKLFVQEVPEIYDGVIKVKAMARDPGSRAKIAVFSEDPSIDPVGSCVGMRGSRVQAVSSELHGEKIDVVVWSSDPAKMAVNVLAPAQVSKIIVDEDNNKLEVVVSEDQLSQVIGRRGQNVKLVAKLVGWQVDIMTEAEESKRRLDIFNNSSTELAELLDIDDVMANLLVSEGYTTIDDLAQASVANLAKIEGFDEDLAAALAERVQLCIQGEGESLTEEEITEDAEEDSSIQDEGESLAEEEITEDVEEDSSVQGNDTDQPDNNSGNNT